MLALTPRRSWAALVVLAVSAFAFVSAELLPIGLLTVIAGDLDRSRSQIGLLVGGYAIVVVLASLPLTVLTRNVPRRAGASWEELHTVMQLAAATGALWAANNGGALLKGLRDKEQGAKP